MRKIAGIVLAAGKGSRMKEENINKVSVLLNNKPIISYGVSILEKMKINPIVIVVGHAKESVINALKTNNVVYAEQENQLGTGHAVQVAMGKIGNDVKDVIILYGDDSYAYTEKTLNEIIDVHYKKDAALTFLTIKVNDPAGLGRVIRNSNGRVTDIIEEKDATEEQKKIKEVNPNCYIFKTAVLKKYLPLITKSPVTGEYYLPAIINLIQSNNENIEVIYNDSIRWQGVNTREELRKAEKNLI